MKSNDTEKELSDNEGNTGADGYSANGIDGSASITLDTS